MSHRPRVYRPAVAQRGHTLPLSPREANLHFMLQDSESATQLQLAQAMGYRDRCGAFRRLLAGIRDKGWM